MTSIKGYVQTVIQDLARGDTGESTEFLRIVDRNVDRLMHLVDDLLDLTSLQSGVELKPKSFKVKELTEDVLSQVDNWGHSVNCIYEVDDLTADEERVEQVLRNLVQNAVRYMASQ